MKRYTSYKPSGVPWLGDVPESWGVERLRFHVKLNPSFSKPLNADLPVSFLPMEAVGDDGTLDLERTRLVGEVAAGYTYFEDGDVTIAKITPCYENGKGAVMGGLLEGVGFGTTELIVMRPIQADCPKWLYYLTKCSAFRLPGEASMQGAGGQKRVSDLFVKNYFAPVPPPDEQQAIADYLDAETTRIDTLIHEKDELIELLKEWRQSMIAEVVTKGLDKTVPMKPSGVPWLGDVPAHWLVAPLKFFLKSLSGGNAIKNTVAHEDGPGLFPAFSASGQDVWMEDYEFDSPGIVVSAVGARCGKTFRANGQWGTVANTHVLLLADGSCRDYFWYLTNDENFWDKGGTAQPFVKVSSTLARKVAVPPPDEQEAIADYLDTETAKIDALIEHAKDDIVLLKELRSATIADAVLGRIDVRTPSLHV